MEIFILDLNKFDRTKFDKDLAQKSYKSELQQYQHLAGQYILNLIAKRYNIANPNIVYRNNKPYFATTEYYFSISHSKNIVAVAFSKYEVGLDIEYNLTKRNYIKILERLDINLALELQSKSEELQQQKFYEFWTQYEAKYKLNIKNNNINFHTTLISNDFTLSVAHLKHAEKIDFIYLN